VILAGALLYALVNSWFLSGIVSRTLGPYSDTLADYVLSNRDPDLWRKIARNHQVTMLVELPGSRPVAFDSHGDPVEVMPSHLPRGQIRAVRTAPDGARVTLFWKVWSFQDSHLPLVAALLVMVIGAVGSAFWFLQRQLRPLTWLRDGVEALGRGDFKARVPVVRDDEIGQVARAFNAMALRVGGMIDDRERLLADVSHELRSPIARMKVALEFVEPGAKKDRLAQDLREMEHLIDMLLERETLRARAGRLAGADVDLEAIAGEVSATFAAKPPGVHVVSRGPVTVQADPALIKLLLQNLIDNAIKFSRPDSRPVEVRLEARGGDVMLSVADDGIGIPAGSDERLFEPFVKLDRARGHRVGYGIGLNLCQRIVQLHGGSIRLQPREPRGAEAVVTLPRHPRAGTRPGE